MFKTRSMALFSIIISVLILDLIIIIGCTVAFDGGEYYGTSGEILEFDDLFYDFSGMENIEYSYTNYSNTVESTYKDIEPLLKDTEYKVLPKSVGRFIVLLQCKLTSRGKIEVARSYSQEDELSSEIMNYDNNVISPSIYYARIFKLFGKYYLYYYPKTKQLYSGFCVCQILNTESFSKSNIINARADKFLYPYIYPSYAQYFAYLPVVRISAIAIFAIEVGIIYKFCLYRIKKKTD